MILHRKLRFLALAAVAAAIVTGGGASAQLVDSAVDRLLQEQIDAALAEALEGRLSGQLDPSLESRLDALRRLAAVPETEPPVDATFTRAVTEDGAEVEDRVWVILATPEQLARIRRQGFDVIEQRRLPALNRVLLRVVAPADRRLAEAALQLKLDTPGTGIDRNHLYRTDAGPSPAGKRDRTGDAAARGRGRERKQLMLGIVDSAVFAGHEALSGADIVQKDFVPFRGPRPLGHGTAVASIVVGDSARLRGELPGARLYAASVFFDEEAGGIGATAASLVQALDWLVGCGVEVVNMSLSGPSNRVLEAAVAGVVARGTTIVAAVGNGGPAAAPLYPAAYEGVVGVTALDAADGVYRYANRGPQVTFSAPGVAVPVALSDGAYGESSGTSMAAPHAAAIVARSLAASRRGPARVLALLQAAARDLGEPGFDETYGFGRIVAPD